MNKLVINIKNRLKKYYKNKDYNLIKNSDFFDYKWYKKNYNIKGDAIRHYCDIGYKLGYNPSNKFSRIKYELIYDDVRYVKANPLLHFEKYGKYEPIFLNKQKILPEEKIETENAIVKQNNQIRIDYDSNTKKLIVFLVPEVDFVGGGVLSINSIASETKKLKKIHHSEVILCTIPNEKTFFKYTKFKSEFNVYRFNQIEEYFKNIEEILFHIPEVYVLPFLEFLTPDQQIWLKKIKSVKFNILNQNIELCPRPRIVNYLKQLSNEVTMTCAHQKYCVKQLRTSYDISVHMLSTSNLVNYKYVRYKNKSNILLYSPDKHPMKNIILDKIRQNFPNLKMIEIKNMKYKDYLKHLEQAKWMITFGEGLDGYFSESIRSGTLAFAVYNLNFFNEKYKNIKNIYSSYNSMLENIVNDLKKYEDEKTYDSLVKKCIEIDKKEYNDDEYKENIKKYYKKEYTFPIEDVFQNRKKLLESNPLISIAVATYNGEKYIKKQIDSLLSLNYKNKEIIVSDDNSTDKTYDILKQYGNKIKLIKNPQKGLNSNFVNAIKQCSGEYIALCDQDDIWEKNKLEILLEHIDDFDLVHGGVSIIDDEDNYHNNKSLHKSYEIDKTNFYQFSDFIKENSVLGCTSLIRTSFLKKYLDIPNNIIYHDWWIVLNAIKNGKGIVYIDNEIIKYRQHNNNTAYLTYNNNNWSIKKIKSNNVILSHFKLNDIETKLIDNDTFYNYIRNVFIKYIPIDTDKYFSDNYKYFNYDFIREITNLLNKEI